MHSLPWTLAWSRIRRHRLRTFSASAAVSLALLSLLSLQAISHSTGNSLVSYSLAKLPLGDQSLTLTTNHVIASPEEFASIDRYLTTKLSSLFSGPLTHELLYREIPDSHGIGYYLGGVDNLTKSAVLTSGRFPTACTPIRCEVVQIGGRNDSPPRPGAMGLVIVGAGSFHNSQLFSGSLSSNDGAALLIADGIAASSRILKFANLEGTNGWVGRMNLEQIATNGSDAYIHSMIAFENRLSIDHPAVTLTWPQDALAGSGDASKNIADKFVLLDFVVGALLIAFLILFSLRHRNEHALFRAGLSRIGTPKRIIATELAIEHATPLALGILGAAALSLSLPTALSMFGFHANFLGIYHGWPKYVFLVLACLGLVIAASIVGDKAWRRQEWIPFLAGTLFLGIFLRAGNSHEVRSWIIPFAYTLIPALITYSVLRGLSAIWRRKSNIDYILIREHLSMWQGVAAILTLAIILAMIAFSFESGISQKVSSQSQDQVPLDVSIRVGPSLIRPLDLGSAQDYEKLFPGSTAYPVLSSGTGIRSQSSVSDSLMLIGIPPSAIKKMPNSALRHLSSISTPTNLLPEVGVAIASTNIIHVKLALIPKEVDLFAWFRTPFGTHRSAVFTGHGNRRTLATKGLIPSGSHLVAFEMRETSDYLSRRLHAMGEGSFAVPMLKGTGSLVSVDFDGHVQSFPEKAWRFKNFSYEFNGAGLYLRPAIPQLIPRVIVDPITASLATNGFLTLTGQGDGYYRVQVGEVVKTFPSAGDRFVIMNLQQLQNEIAQTDLGAIDPLELWISTPNSSIFVKNLEASRFQGLIVESRHELEKALRSDPTNVGLDGAYKISLFFALLIALFMYASALPLLYNESAQVLFQMEASGSRPSKLRSALRRSLRLTVVVALNIGAAIGILVGHFFISTSTPYLGIALTVFALLSLSELGGFLITRNFFTEATAVRA